MPFYKDTNEAYYSYVEGGLNFLYYPHLGKVQANNNFSLTRAIEHFCVRGWAIDWDKTKLVRYTLFLSGMDHLSEELQIELLSTTIESLYAQSVADEAKARDKLLLSNVRNEDDTVIREDSLDRAMYDMKSSGKETTRDAIVDWFNHFNLETIKLDSPVIIRSTKSKSTIIAEGSKPLWELFEKGELRLLTLEQYTSKMTNHGSKK